MAAVGSETNGDTVRGTCARSGCVPVSIVLVKGHVEGEGGDRWMLTIVAHCDHCAMEDILQ